MCRSQDESVFVGLVCVYQRGRRARLREHVLACMSIVVGSYFRNPNIFDFINPRNYLVTYNRIHMMYAYVTTGAKIYNHCPYIFIM